MNHNRNFVSMIKWVKSQEQGFSRCDLEISNSISLNKRRETTVMSILYRYLKRSVVKGFVGFRTRPQDTGIAKLMDNILGQESMKFYSLTGANKSKVSQVNRKSPEFIWPPSPWFLQHCSLEAIRNIKRKKWYLPQVRE